MQPTKRRPFGARRPATVDGDLSATDITGRLGRRRGPQKNRFLKWLWANRRVTMLVLTLVLAGALLAGVPGLHKVVKRISHVNPWWIVLAVAVGFIAGGATGALAYATVGLVGVLLATVILCVLAWLCPGVGTEDRGYGRT